MLDARFELDERTHRERMLAGDQYIADDPVLRRESDRAALLIQAFGIIEAASFQHALEDCECRWNFADVDHDLLDLSAPAPFKSRDVVQFRFEQIGALVWGDDMKPAGTIKSLVTRLNEKLLEHEIPVAWECVGERVIRSCK